MKKLFYAMLCALAFSSFISCEKHHEPSQEITGTTGILGIEMEHVFGPNAFQINTPFTDSIGDTVFFNSGHYFISHIRLLKTDGSFFECAQQQYIALNIPNTAIFSLLNIPNGDYTGVQLAIGTDTSSVFGSFSGTFANSPFNYFAYRSTGVAYTPVYDFGSILSISPDAAPIMHMSVDMSSLFANGMTPPTYDTIQVGTTESEAFLSNLLGAISFEHLHQ
jgi:hypothetical protein